MSDTASRQRGLVSRLRAPLLLLLPLLLVLSSVPRSLGSDSVIPKERRCFSDAELSSLGVKPTERAADLPTILVERQGWVGHYLTTAIGSILLSETLGYDIEIQDGDGNTIYESVGEQTSRVNFEVWTGSRDPHVYQQLFVDEGSATNAGSLGVLGFTGWWIPTYLLSDPAFADYFVDFWRSYRIPELTALFPRSSEIPESKKTGGGREFVPPWCVKSTTPAGCSTSSYDADFRAGNCVVEYEDGCIPLLGIAEGYDKGILQGQIYNLRLNVTVPFMSEDNFYDVAMSYYNDGKPFMFYYWGPTPFLLTAPFTRVLLPSYTTECFANHTANLDGHGSVNCDFPSNLLIKIHSTAMLDVPAYAGAVQLLRQFSYTNSEQEELMRLMPTVSSQWDEAAFNLSCTWLKADPNRWRALWVHNEEPTQLTLLLLSDGTVIGVASVVALGMLGSLLLHVVLFVGRTNPVFVRSSVAFCQLIVGGSWFGYAALLVFPATVSAPGSDSAAGRCLAFPILLCVCFLLMFGSLSVKTFRLYKIFSGKKLAVVRISNVDLLKPLLAALLIDAIIFALWAGVDSPTIELQLEGESRAAYVCNSSHWVAWYLALLLPKCLVVAGCVYIAWSVRGLSSEFNESQWIGIAIYNLTILGVIALSLLALVGGDANIRYLLLTLGVLGPVLVQLGVLFLPKLLVIRALKSGKAKLNSMYTVGFASAAGAAGSHVNPLSHTNEGDVLSHSGDTTKPPPSQLSSQAPSRGHGRGPSVPSKGRTNSSTAPVTAWGNKTNGNASRGTASPTMEGRTLSTGPSSPSVEPRTLGAYPSEAPAEAQPAADPSPVTAVTIAVHPDPTDVEAAQPEAAAVDAAAAAAAVPNAATVAAEGLPGQPSA